MPKRPPHSALPSAFVEFVAPGLAVRVATRDADQRPECVLGCGATLNASRRVLTVFIADAHLGRTLENVTGGGPVAVSLCRVSDYRTYQVKGRALGHRAARRTERALLEAHGELFARDADETGVGDALRRLAYWPASAVEVEVLEVFLQTPGPGTGERLRR